MMVNAPIPPAAAGAAAKPAPVPVPAASTATPTPDAPPASATGTPGPDATGPAPTGADQAAAGATPTDDAGAPAGSSAPKDAAAAKQAVIEKLEKTTAVDAMSQVDSHLEKISSLSVGGGTKEGVQGAKVASALLTDASMLLQHAHVKAMEQLRTMATELHIRMMSSASGLAYMGGQVAIAGQSKEPVKLADIVAGPIAETKQAMADVAAAIAPAKEGAAPPDGSKGGAKPDPAGAAPVPSAADAVATPAGPDAAPTPAAPPAANGNTGVVPSNLQHVTPGPGAGPGPNPA